MFQGTINFKFYHYKSIGSIDPLDVTSLDPVARLAGFMKRTTKHCHIIKLYKLCASWFQRRKFILDFPIINL